MEELEKGLSRGVSGDQARGILGRALNQIARWGLTLPEVDQPGLSPKRRGHAGRAEGPEYGADSRVPRLDLWYNAHTRAGSLPARYKAATLMQITKELDIGYHAVVPNFKGLRDPADELHRALGVYNLWTMPDRTVFEGVRITAEYEGETNRVRPSPL